MSEGYWSEVDKLTIWVDATEQKLLKGFHF